MDDLNHDVGLLRERDRAQSPRLARPKGALGREYKLHTDLGIPQLDAGSSVRQDAHEEPMRIAAHQVVPNNAETEFDTHLEGRLDYAHGSPQLIQRRQVFKR